MDEIERLAVERLFDRVGDEPPAIRIYTPNDETSTHQMIFLDRLTDWQVTLGPPEWSLVLATAEYDFLCNATNIAELKVRLKPAVQVWLRTPGNQWVAEIFRWSDFHPGEPFAAFIPEAWRENNPPRLLPS